MPGTAAERGLEDPFDVATAIPASAHFLAELRDRFGNLGLAAAAYNAGPERVSNWLADDATLPFETQNFVVAITGVAADTWADPEAKPTLPAEPENAKDCLALAALLKGPGAELAPQIETASAPWGVQVAGGYSRALVIGAYSRLQSRFPALFADRDPMIIGGRMPRARRASVLPYPGSRPDPRGRREILLRAQEGRRDVHRAEDMISISAASQTARISSVVAVSTCWLKRLR